MDAETLVREWGVIAGLLPAGWRELARSTGALRRARRVRDPDTLLLLILLHVAAGLSLRQAAARARRMGLAEVSDVGLHKRLRASAAWLHGLAAAMFAGSRFRRGLSELPGARRIRVVDATHVREPGSTGSIWRVHYVLQLPSLECDFFEVTDPGGGETFRRVPIEAGDLVLGDRGYAHREGAAHVIERGGGVLVRLNASSFPLEDMTGSPLALVPVLRSLAGHEPGEWPVRFRCRGQHHAVRLCAIRKSEAAAEHGRTSLRRAARRRQRALQPETLEMAGYTAVLTSLDQTATTAQVLELYRARWQVELAFRRLKSLLGAGHVPKHDPESARAWLHAKLLATLLIERLSEEARFFSPWGFELHQTEPVARIHRGT
jgi:hypothetical protein